MIEMLLSKAADENELPRDCLPAGCPVISLVKPNLVNFSTTFPFRRGTWNLISLHTHTYLPPIDTVLVLSMK